MTLRSYRDSHLGPAVAAGYDRDYMERYPAQYWHHVEAPLLDGLLDEVLPGGLSPVRHLDLACGTGRIIAHLAPRTTWSVGVDISPDMLTHARRRAPEAAGFALGDITAPPVAGSFDLITAFRFFLNAEPDLRSEGLAAIRRILAPGGVLVANIHCQPWSPLGVWRRGRRALGRPADSVLGIDAFESVLVDEGFSPVAERTYGFLPLTARLSRGATSRALCRLDPWVASRARERSRLASSWLVAARVTG